MDYNPDCPAWGSLTWPKVGEFNLANGGPGSLPPFEEVTTKGIRFLEKRLEVGRGIRLNMDGTFKGFIQ